MALACKRSPFRLLWPAALSAELHLRPAVLGQSVSTGGETHAAALTNFHAREGSSAWTMYLSIRTPCSRCWLIEYAAMGQVMTWVSSSMEHGAILEGI